MKWGKICEKLHGQIRSIGRHRPGTSGLRDVVPAKSFTGGFSETMLAPDTFKINFSGNGFTSGERASDFAILRAADKSIALGCSYFSVMNEADSATVGSVSFGSASWGRRNAWATSTTMPVVKPNSNLLVKCYASQPQDTPAFDANFIAESIRQKYGIKPLPGTSIVMRPSAPAAPVAVVSIPVAAPQVYAAPVSATQARVAASGVNIATMVLDAQKISNTQDCGDVRSIGGSNFQAPCSEFDIVIDCDGGSCQPTHTVRR
jgi:hypothetical protein